MAGLFSKKGQIADDEAAASAPERFAFRQGAFKRIGLLVDEYRWRLPTDAEAGRVESAQSKDALG
jgi:hypothetical protein